MIKREDYSSLWLWHQNLSCLTTEFVEQTAKFFNHCQQVEQEFGVTTQYLLSEKRRLVQQEYYLNQKSSLEEWHESNTKLNEREYENEEMNLLLDKIKESEERETTIKILVDKFSNLAQEFERILKDSERPNNYHLFSPSKIDVSTITDQSKGSTQSSQTEQVQTETDEDKKIKSWLFQEKLFLSHQRDELSQLEKRLKSREDNVRRLEEDLQLKLKQFHANTHQNISSPCPVRSSLSVDSISPQLIPPILSPPPDLRASSFDRFKRFPHVHLLKERYTEISNSAKSSGQFNRYHYYLSKMMDILDFYQNKNLQLSEKIESNKFVSVISIGTNTQVNYSHLDNVTDKIIAIGHGNSALEATEKSVQIAHEMIQNSNDLFKINYKNFDDPFQSQNPVSIHESRCFENLQQRPSSYSEMGAGDYF